LYQNFRQVFPFKQILRQENQSFIRFFDKINLVSELVLDIGTGHGNGLQLIKSHFTSGQNRTNFTLDNEKKDFIDAKNNKNVYLIGVDRSASMLKSARNIQTGVFVQADALVLPFKDESFSIILAIGLVEYLKNKRLFLKEISRILKSGGKVILTISPMNLFSFFRFFYGLRLFLISSKSFEILIDQFNLKIQNKSKTVMQIQYLLYKV